MSQQNNSTPDWVRCMFGVTGCAAILLLIGAQCFGVSFSASVVGAVAVFSVCTACLAFNRAIPAAMSRLISGQK